MLSLTPKVIGPLTVSRYNVLSCHVISMDLRVSKSSHSEMGLRLSSPAILLFVWSYGHQINGMLDISNEYDYPFIQKIYMSIIKQNDVKQIEFKL